MIDSNSNSQLQLEDIKMQQMLRAWKSKSLNSKSMQYYKIPLQNSKEQDTSQKKHNQVSKVPVQQSKQQLLPQPKIIKINQSLFCIFLYSKLMIFKLATQQQKQIFRINKQSTFYPQVVSFKSHIKFCRGGVNSDFIYVGFQNQLHILKLQYTQSKNQDGKINKTFQKAVTVQVKKIQRIKGVNFIRVLQNQIEIPILIVLTNEKIIKYRLNGEPGQKPLQQLKIVYPQKHKNFAQTFRQIKKIQILIENNINLYFFGAKQGQQFQQQSSQKGKRQRKCQYLYLIKFNLDVKNVDSIQPTVNIIDHVFQVGIFSKSKVFQSGPNIFLISLYEQIIVIKYHFQKFVVWDNISLASSKSIQKKGQLILADKIVMVYTEMGQIYAHNILFSFKQSKLKYPRIDNFRGNDNDQQILYDAIVLQYEPGSFMKVLFYFKQADVYTPSHKVMVHKQDKIVGQHKQLQLAIRCIQQNDPLIKLAQLFKNKKPPNQIAEFVQRFSIDQLNKSKCQWSVSEKNQKDIENLLLQIKSNQYIQNQLTQILKSNPHDLKFLSKIQKKQIQRYKKMLATKMLKNDQPADPQKLRKIFNQTNSFFQKDQVQQIKQIIKWVMESIMFQKKLAYSKNFLQFMQYQFIDIGKLKAASLKQQIKLLSCKGYQKRLQYFLNSFKYMILANFQNIFEFLIEDKNVAQIQKFFKQNFPFILPKFQQSSQIFKKKNANMNQKYIRARKTSFAPIMFSIQSIIKRQQTMKQQDKCQLWQDKFNDQSQIKKIQTKQSFKKQIQDQIQTKHNNQIYKQKQQKRNNLILNECLKKQDSQKQFAKILDQFMKQRWFLQNKSKQHSIIQFSVEQLRLKMQYLKRIGVFHLLIKFFYKKIKSQKYRQQDVDRTLLNFRKANLIPQSFEQNVLARRQIYQKISSNKKINVSLPLLQDFLIFEQTHYFNYLFQHYRGMLLKQVKNVYDNTNTGIPGLFKQKFQIYLNSNYIDLSAIIDFLDQFQGNSNDDIRMDVFTCIKKLLKVSDRENTASFVNKLMQKQILKHQGASNSGIDTLIDQAKIAFGFYFYQFFQIFQINTTYKQVIQETTKQQYDKCNIIKHILTKYCKQDYIKDTDINEQEQSQGFIKFQERFGLEEIQFTIIEEPLEFFGIMLYLIDTLRFQIKPYIIFDKFVQLLLEEQSYQNLVYFIEDFRQRIGGQVDSQFQYENNSQDFKSRNYQLLKQFYQGQGTTVQDRLIQNILIWSRKLYKALSQRLGPSMPRKFIKKLSQNPLQKISFSFEKVLRVLGYQNAQIIRQRSFLQMLNHVLQVQPRLLCYILKTRFQNSDNNRLLQQNSSLLNNLSGFMFMIKLLKAIPQQKFNQINDQQKKNYKRLHQLNSSIQQHKRTNNSSDVDQITQIKSLQQQILKIQNLIKVQIYAFQCIYTKFQFASKYDYSKISKQQKQFGLIRFYMELSMKLIKDKHFFYSYAVILNIINKQYYFRDVFLFFMASIKQVKGRPSDEDFKKFIKFFISSTHDQNIIKNFNAFIKQNQIISFNGQKQKNQQNGQDEQKQVQQYDPTIMKKQHTGQSVTFGLQSQKNRLKDKKISKKQKINLIIQKKNQNRFSNFGKTSEQYCSQKFTMIIFESLIQSHKTEQAYYFLVRNQLLSVVKALQMTSNRPNSNSNSNVQSYALISIYMKCLKQFLCTQFYPTFTFYRNKIQALNNSIQRKDIIKDINIAISRLKQLISQQKLSIGQQQKIMQTSMNFMKSVVQKNINIQDSNGQKDTTQSPKKPTQQQKQQKHEQLQNMKNRIVRLSDHLSQLNTLYIKFMDSIHENPVIKLDQQQNRTRFNSNMRQSNVSSLRDSTPYHTQRQNPNININLYNPNNNPNIHQDSRTINAKQLAQRQFIEQQQHQKQLQMQKKKIKQNPEFLQLQRQLNHQLKETKLLGQKYEKQSQLLNNNKKIQNKANKIEKVYNQLKQKQKFELGAVKEGYKSQTAERVNQFLQQMRMRKSKIYEKSQKAMNISQIDHNQTSRKNSDEFLKNNFNDLISPPNLMNKIQKSISGVGSDDQSSQKGYQVKIHQINGNTKDMYLPVTMNNQKLTKSKVSVHNNKWSTNNQEIYPKHQSQVGTLRNSPSNPSLKFGAKSQVKTNNTFEQLLKLFEQKQPQCKKYIQKLEIVKNNLQVGLQLTKNIYSTINSFEVFIRYIGFILQNYPNYKQVIQEKAYKIAHQAMGIQYKINLKELFSLEFFTKVVNVSIKQYYKTAYQVIRPNLLKILSKPETNVHGMAILYRFGFGSQNVYYYRVYEDYIKILIKAYSQQSPDQKKIFLLSQKLRTLYNNINTQNRQSKFEQLIRQIPNQNKRQILVRQMLKILQRRNQMLTGQKQTDLKDVLQKLC